MGAEPAPSIHTGGGMAALGDVNAGGDVIGRDQYNVVNLTMLLQPELLAGLSGRDAAAIESTLRCYLHALIDTLTPLRLDQIDTRAAADGQPLRLDDVFEPLDTREQMPADRTLGQWLGTARKSSPKADRQDVRQRPVTALEALAHHPKLTLLGAAGGGKSTVGAWVLVVLARAWLGDATALAKLGDGWPHGALLPIRVTLRYFAETLKEPGSGGLAERLWDHIVRSLQQDGYTLPVSYLKNVATQRGALFLFDGLDECGTSEQCAQVLKAIEALESSIAGTRSRFLRTARPNAWKGGPSAAKGVYELAGLNEEQVDRFIARWYTAADQHDWPLRDDQAVLIADLQQASRREELRELAANPLLLTLMVALHTVDRLPDDRVDLYREAVALLLMRWDDKDAKGAGASLRRLLALPHFRIERLLPTLEQVAFETHEAKESAVSEYRLLDGFRKLFAEADDPLGCAQKVVTYIVERTGLLSWDGGDRSPRRFEFPHRSFREYLAACHMAHQPEMARQCIALARSDPALWELPLVLAARVAGSERGTLAAQALVESWPTPDSPTDADWLCARLAGLQLKEIGKATVLVEPYRRVMADRVVAALMRGAFPSELTGNGVPAKLRSRLGDAIGALDPRFDAENYFLPCGDDLGFVSIPSRDDLCFARYPVTVAQFRAFVVDSGFEPGDPDCLRDPDHRPVRYVNHAEALAYCEWLTGTGCLPSGWRADLPDEHEWEHASRGGASDKWDYWWKGKADPERANYNDTGIGDTSVVGCFPSNGYGLYDMLGNVWEWTKSPWSESDSDPVVRGGSWLNSAGLLRCVCRSRSLPDARNYLLGFRVVLRCSPV